jgi:hypothetical protein
MGGRAKHTDPQEQDGWLADLIQAEWQRKLQANEKDDPRMGDVRVVGHREESGRTSIGRVKPALDLRIRG